MPTLGSIKLSQPIDPDVGLKQLDVVEDAKQAVMAKGFRIAMKPGSNGFDGIMPTDLTSLDDNQLGDLLNNITQWCGYTDTQLVQARSEYEASEARLELLQSHIRIAVKATEGKMTVQDKTDIMNTDPRVVEAKSRYLYCYTVYEYVRSFKAHAERNWDTVSRRITQRGQDVERMKRGENVGNTHSGLRSPFRK